MYNIGIWFLFLPNQKNIIRMQIGVIYQASI